MSQQIEWNGPNKDYGIVSFGQDKDLVVKIYWRSMPDTKASEAAGAPVYKNVEYIDMFRPGEMMNMIVRPLTDADKRRFKSNYDQFVLQKTQVPEGTPVDLLFPNNPAVADSLRGYGIYTIQQLTNLSATAIDSIGMGGQDFVNKAKAYMNAASSGKEVVKMQEDMRKMARDAVRKDEQIAGLQAQVNALIENMKNKPQQDINNPPDLAGDDTQANRINANHVTNDLSKKFRKP